MYVRHLWKIDRFSDISSPKYSTRTSLKVILDMWHVMLQGPLVHYPINTLPYISTCGTSQSYTRAHKFGSIFPRVVVSHFEIGSIWFRLESASFTDGMSKCHSFIRSESIRACVLWSRVIQLSTFTDDTQPLLLFIYPQHIVLPCLYFSIQTNSDPL